jgi:hypothetical protein
MPRIVAYAPKLLGGLGMQRMYTTQGVRNTMQMLKHMRAGTTVGKLFKIGISWLQRWAGIGQCMMQRPDREIPPTTSKLLMSIREFLALCRSSITMSKPPKGLRADDTFIMDHALNSKFSRHKINMMNKIRMYLQVETIAEIATPDGSRTERSWLQEGQKPSKSTELWPQIHIPSGKCGNLGEMP